MKDLNITLEIIAAYRQLCQAEETKENSKETYTSAGLVERGSKADRKAVNAARKKFVKSVIDAGNTGDWDTERIIGKLSNQPAGIAYVF